MGQIRRIVHAGMWTVGMALASIFHFRVGMDQLYPLAQNEFSGPFTPLVDSLEYVVPLAIAIIVLTVWTWVLVSPVQNERTRRSVRR